MNKYIIFITVLLTFNATQSFCTDASTSEMIIPAYITISEAQHTHPQDGIIDVTYEKDTLLPDASIFCPEIHSENTKNIPISSLLCTDEALTLNNNRETKSLQRKKESDQSKIKMQKFISVYRGGRVVSWSQRNIQSKKHLEHCSIIYNAP